MSDYINGCSNKKGCQGLPTHIYRPQGGRAVAYCVACMPAFLRSRVSVLETTADYEKTVEQMYATLAAQNEEAPKKSRRRRKQVEEPVVEEVEAVEAEEEPTPADEAELPAEESPED
jgi:hypothetical protein